jgi:hypothetical protein
MNHDFQDEGDLRDLFKYLVRHAPRPGYEQRFWARAGGTEAPRPLAIRVFVPWRWVPAAAVALGLIAGLAAANLSRPQPWTVSASVVGSLAAGSLADTLAFKAEE